MQDKDLFPEGPLELPGEPSQTSEPRPSGSRRFGSKKIQLVTLGLLIAAGAGFGIWKALNRDSATETTANSQQQTAPETAPLDTAMNDVPAAGDLKTFKSDHPRIELSYPAAWTVTEADNGVRVESPEFTYNTVNADNLTGHFRLYIRQGARSSDSPYIGSGTAIEPSETLIYSQPAPGQRGETNLTHFGYDTPDHFAYFFIAGNYALQRGETLGPDYGKEPETYIIAGGYSSEDLSDDLSMQRVSLDYYQTTNAYQQALDIVKSLKVL